MSAVYWSSILHVDYSRILSVYLTIFILKHFSFIYCFFFYIVNMNDDDHDVDLGPVLQSIVSLTSSLRVISLTVLADSIYNILIKATHIFSAKNFSIFVYHSM